MMSQMELYELFHEAWNIMTAATSYVAVLRMSPAPDPVQQQAVEDLDKLMKRLESSLEGIRARMLSANA